MGVWPNGHLKIYDTEQTVWNMLDPIYYQPMMFLGWEKFKIDAGDPTFVRWSPIFLIGDKKYKVFAMAKAKSGEIFQMIK